MNGIHTIIQCMAVFNSVDGAKLCIFARTSILLDKSSPIE